MDERTAQIIAIALVNEFGMSAVEQFTRDSMVEKDFRIAERFVQLVLIHAPQALDGWPTRPVS